jgi:hypothetical protein
VIWRILAGHQREDKVEDD